MFKYTRQYQMRQINRISKSIESLSREIRYLESSFKFYKDGEDQGYEDTIWLIIADKKNMQRLFSKLKKYDSTIVDQIRKKRIAKIKKRLKVD